ncbi:sialate O-acetylesterase [Galbibacter sp. PAP.153]|uniref:sialate O-acetylesterase n=1 Tax=Galbibacter sp. PAP.153 TaxID=3104623 RepID=UPI003007F8DD
MKNLRQIVAVLFILTTFNLSSQISLPKLISDGMVLQRDIPITVWGWASAEENITILFKGKTYHTKAGQNGNWEVDLEAGKAGGPYTMRISGSNTIEVNNILVGDVWVCSGQSNMEIPMSRVKPLYEAEIPKANYPTIRYFEVPKTYNFSGEQEQIDGGKWLNTTPETVLNFSAIAYFFAKDLTERYQVPIGLINTSLGGSPAEAWLSEDALKKFPKAYNELLLYKDSTYVNGIISGDRERIANWYREVNTNDLGNAQHWETLNIDSAKDWTNMEIPGYWNDQIETRFNGVAWYKKAFKISPAHKDVSGKLLLGRIVDADSVFINGHFIGNTTYQYPPRRYNIPENILKEGENQITVKVINERGKGGFVPEKPYQIVLNDTTISLTGTWKFKKGVAKEPLKPQTFVRWKPAGLFNAMIAPLLNYKIQGVIWYQGESNTGSPDEYQALFSTLINEWRARWELGDFPFLYVQLANFMKSTTNPEESNWAMLRNQQLKTLTTPNTGMAVTIDIGEWNDIHPLNKKDVGHRLALLAEKIAYHEKNTVASGPLYKSSEIKGNKIVVSFNGIGSGLVAKNGDSLHSFAVAGADKNYVWAKATIHNNKVIVWSNSIANPKYVRYAWANNPDKANLYNKEGLPASPFQTE